MQSSNPFLKEDTFDDYQYITGEDRPIATTGPGMTVGGTAGKALILILLALGTTAFAWDYTTRANPSAALPMAIGSALLGLALAVGVSFKPTLAPMLAPVYALVEGLFLGVISSFLEQRYPGIAFQAVLLTFAVSTAMLGLYQAKVIRATPAFVRGVIGCTMGIFVMYLISFGMSMFGMRMPFLHDSSPIGIGISVVILGVAALNLILDFDVIEKGVNANAPKWMEWYGAFGLVVTLFWIYIESLRLLSKLRR